MLKQILIWLGASAVTLLVIFVSVVVYQYTAMEPELPHEDECDIRQLETSEDGALEVHSYWCERGEKQSWQGHEIWLHEPLPDKWERIMTTEHDGCIKLELADQRLEINHDGKRGDMFLVEPVFLFNDAQGVSQSLSVQVSTRGDAVCSGSGE